MSFISQTMTRRLLPALLLANRASLGGYPVVRQPAASGS